jgi:hypothetical protein
MTCADLHVTSFLTEYRIEDGRGNIVGSRATDEGFFRAMERRLEQAGTERDSIGFVFTKKHLAINAIVGLGRDRGNG